MFGRHIHTFEKTTSNIYIDRDTAVLEDPACEGFKADGYFGSKSAEATATFQKSLSIPATGKIDAITAQSLLDYHSADNVKDTG
jgi:peptidoglycan hydrolase-like protein with peptidoglycan-binding domain